MRCSFHESRAGPDAKPWLNLRIPILNRLDVLIHILREGIRVNHPKLLTLKDQIGPLQSKLPESQKLRTDRPEPRTVGGKPRDAPRLIVIFHPDRIPATIVDQSGLPLFNDPLELWKLPFTKSPFIPVAAVELHVLELYDEVELRPGLVPRCVPHCFAGRDAAGHFCEREHVVVGEDLLVHFLHVFVDSRTASV